MYCEKNSFIAFRVNASSDTGFGHINRCLRLAKQLQSLNYQVIFINDKFEKRSQSELNGIKFISLYSGNKVFEGEKKDAKLFLEKVKSFFPVCVISDDYRISKKWECLVRERYPLVVFDDENKRYHFCDILVDSNWRGDETSFRYLNLVPTSTKRLLGPQYAILGGGLLETEVPSRVVSRINKPSMLISLGGGGDMLILLRVIKAIISNPNCNPDISIKVVIGPYATNSEFLLKYAAGNSQIVPVIGQKDLSDFFLSSSLYVGSAGTTMYESLIYKIPSITFSLSENQKYDERYLEDLGHYFHFNDFDALNIERLADFAWLAIENIERLTNLYLRKPRVLMDGNGAIRLAKKIHELIQPSHNPRDPLLIESDNLINDGASASGVSYFGKIEDIFVNKYLYARDLPENSIAITNSTKINRIDHYIWWLKTERCMYALFKGDIPRVYCWHQLSNEPPIYIKGGFFAASEDTTGIEIIKAVHEHHKLTDDEYPQVQWYAITRKDNVFANFLNERIGFIQLEHKSKYLRLFSNIFGDIKIEKYILYKKTSPKVNFSTPSKDF